MLRIILFSTLFAFTACQSDKSVTEELTTTPHKSPVANESLDNKRLLIDAKEDQLIVANSLTYQHNDGSTEEVLAFLDDQENIVKIEEKFSDADTRNSGKRIFYFENSKKFMTVELFMDNKDSKGAFRERVSYYNKNETVKSSKDRLAPFEEDLEKMEFKKIGHYDCSVKRAMAVLNNEGVFKTTFQGFLENGYMTYLLVGGPGESGYATAIAVQYDDSQITKLKKNTLKYINKPLKVKFERMLDEKNMEFQVLISAQLLDDK